MLHRDQQLVFKIRSLVDLYQTAFYQLSFAFNLAIFCSCLVFGTSWAQVCLDTYIGDMIFMQNVHALALKKVEEEKGTFKMDIEEVFAILSKNQNAMAELEYWLELCKVVGIGSYDYFKFLNDQKKFRIEMLRTSLKTFGDWIVDMVDKPESPVDIQFQNKWISDDTAYRRLVESVDSADYYGKQKAVTAIFHRGLDHTATKS